MVNKQRFLREATGQARCFERVRQAHRLEVAEDYLELISDLISCTGEARLVDIAERMGVTSATANNTVSRLERDGFVARQPYRSIFLTGKGESLADGARERHRLVVDFLQSLGIDGETAEADAEGMEHHISQKTLGIFREFINRDPEKA